MLQPKPLHSSNLYQTTLQSSFDIIQGFLQKYTQIYQKQNCLEATIRRVCEKMAVQDQIIDNMRKQTKIMTNMLDLKIQNVRQKIQHSNSFCQDYPGEINGRAKRDGVIQRKDLNSKKMKYIFDFRDEMAHVDARRKQELPELNEKMQQFSQKLNFIEKINARFTEKTQEAFQNKLSKQQFSQFIKKNELKYQKTIEELVESQYQKVSAILIEKFTYSEEKLIIKFQKLQESHFKVFEESIKTKVDQAQFQTQLSKIQGMILNLIDESSLVFAKKEQTVKMWKLLATKMNRIQLQSSSEITASRLKCKLDIQNSLLKISKKIIIDKEQRSQIKPVCRRDFICTSRQGDFVSSKARLSLKKTKPKTLHHAQSLTSA